MSITIEQANKLIDAFSAAVVQISEASSTSRTLFKPAYRYTTVNGKVSYLSLGVEYDDPAIAHGYTKKIVDFEEDQLEIPPSMAKHIAEHLVLALLKLKSKI